METPFEHVVPENKEKGAVDPNGVKYVAQLWAQLRDPPDCSFLQLMASSNKWRRYMEEMDPVFETHALK